MVSRLGWSSTGRVMHRLYARRRVVQLLDLLNWLIESSIVYESASRQGGSENKQNVKAFPASSNDRP